MNISSVSWFVAEKSRLSAIQPNIHCIFEQHKYKSWGNGCHRINQMTVSTHPQRMKNTPAMNFQMTRRSQCVFRSGAPLRFSLNAMRHICRPDSSRQGMQKSRLKNSSNGHSSSKMSRVSSFFIFMRCRQTLYAKNKAKYYSYGGDENPFVYVI